MRLVALKQIILPLASHTGTTYPADDVVASASSPVQKITYGYVSYDDASTNYQNFATAGADNAGITS